MSAFPPSISQIVIFTVVDLLLPLFLRYAGTREAAGLVVIDLLEEQAPQTNEELGLAAEIIGLRYKALGLIRDSEQPGTPAATVLQLSKTASALRRNQAAAQRKLDALRRARLGPDKAAPAAEAKPSPPEPDRAPWDEAPAEAPEAAGAPARPGHNARIEAILRHLADDSAARHAPGDDAASEDVLAALSRDLALATTGGPPDVAVPNAPGLQPH